MKFQCSCGAKYAFDLSPEMLERPVQFVCQQCGQDSSELVNQQIRHELSSSSSSASAPVPNLRLRISTPATKAADVEPSTDAALSDTPQFCHKHPSYNVTTKCYICSKPMCPKCMELFGYVCSPLCKARADSHGVAIPVFEGQRSLKEARLGRRIGWATAVISALAVGLLVFWFWYTWFGSEPRVAFSMRFPNRAYAGQTALVANDQLIVLHGGTLIREDMKENKVVWSRNLIDTNQITEAVAQGMQSARAAIERANNDDPDNAPKMPSPDRIANAMEQALEEELQLRLQGSNIWVITPKKLVRYDLQTGNPVQEIPVPAEAERLAARTDELLLLTTHYSGEQSVMRINLTTCDSRTDSLTGEPKADPQALADAAATNLLNLPRLTNRVARSDQSSSRSNAAVAKATSRLISGPAQAGLPVGVPGKNAGKPLDPAKVAAQAQHMSMPARIALPAVLSANMNQERALDEASDRTKPAPQQMAAEPDSITLIPGTNGFTQCAVRLVEQRIVSRSAMKAAPAKSILQGTLTVGNSLEASSQILNDWQRSLGGDKVEEDESRYLVTLRGVGQSAGAPPTLWTGEVIGPPKIFSLQTVNVLAANKMIMIFDKSNNPLWKSSLNYNIVGDGQEGLYGKGPCVEHKGSLYVFDQGVLTAFDLKTGNARWRLPSVGIAGIFFDDLDMMYVNTTTADPESIKYSRQIDISQKTSEVVLKIDPSIGKTLWTVQPGGMVTYVSGPFVYCVQSYQPFEDEDDPYHPDTGFETPPYVRIRRLNPKNGHEMWEHFQQRCPLNVEFDKNTVRLMFKSEVQVLKFVAF